MPPDIETTLCIFRDDVFVMKQYWHEAKPGPVPTMTPVRHRELVLAGFKSEEVTDKLIEKYLDLVHRYALMKEFTHDSCTRAAFGIYVQLRIYCEFGRHKRGGQVQHERVEEPKGELLWPETLHKDWKRPQAKTVPYKSFRRPTKRKKDGNE
jgi:hypothetical protein